MWTRFRTWFYDIFLRSFFYSVPDTSTPGKVNPTDVAKLIRNGIVYGIGMMAVYGLSSVSGMDFGFYSPLIAGICAGLIDTIRKSLTDNGVTIN